MQAISKQQFKAYIEEFDFTGLFNYLGWTNTGGNNPVKVNEQTLILHSVAEKSGFRIMVCEGDSAGNIPDYSTRLKLDHAVARLYREHLIIFQDSQRKEQLWQSVVRQPGKPHQLAAVPWHRGQEPELLYQKTSGLFFTLDEEDNITIVDVTERVAANFHQNREKITKKFYDGFKKEHKAFLGFIKGIGEQGHREWYASLMLNRLMFCYFIQKQSFLDNNINYLRDKLKSNQQKKGKNKFYSFYRDFLLALFHQGLGAPMHSAKLRDELGRIPYLNGGLFDVHRLEQEYKNINIDDKAFESIFNFFDEWNWHLDTRETASGRDINPDVIGYIFEKYINDRAQMGAYYTKEDITDYIGKNCIIPFLFDETARQYKQAFHEDGDVWSMLKNSGDEYIYDAVKHGINPDHIWRDLPEDVQAGLNPEQPDLVEKRRCWNRPALEEAALPTEIWREVIERRKRYQEVRSRIENGEIKHINDFITNNLNIRQFAQDLVENTSEPKLIMRFYQALSSLTILDPTCGSGAFLFAAMNILEPLYEACLLRMENFVAEARKGKYKYFEETLLQVNATEHPNRKYFIFKSIILRNLYGVDIMHEAVEIAKLRLFLKLVATVDPDYRKPNLGLEPLPDIDYNIRVGNTLIGYANEVEVDAAFAGQLDFDNDKEKIKERCEEVAMVFNRFEQSQLINRDEYKDSHQAKKDLNRHLETLNHDLNVLLHKQTSDLKYNNWLKTHQPFHWLAEFYEIIHDKGGFDVIIGNPPYVENKKVSYNIENYGTNSCGNLYAYVVERNFYIVNKNARAGMIIPHSAICTNRMESLIKMFSKYHIWLSSYDIRPSKLFSGVDQRLLIYLAENGSKNIHTSNYHRWFSDYREYLFQTIEYVDNIKSWVPNSIIKASKNIEKSILNKIGNSKNIGEQIQISAPSISCHNAPRYFNRVMNKIPYFWNEKRGEQISSQIKSLSFANKDATFTIGSLLNSTLFYWWFILYSDSRHLNQREIDYFPFSLSGTADDIKKHLVKLFIEINADFEKHKVRKSVYYKATGAVKYDEYYPKYSKPIIDEIDTVLAKHYGFTPEELDFIINYDIKYRMGKELEGDEEEE